jgi:hypothetical protein
MESGAVPRASFGKSLRDYAPARNLFDSAFSEAAEPVEGAPTSTPAAAAPAAGGAPQSATATEVPAFIFVQSSETAKRASRSAKKNVGRTSARSEGSPMLWSPFVNGNPGAGDVISASIAAQLQDKLKLADMSKDSADQQATAAKPAEGAPAQEPERAAPANVPFVFSSGANSAPTPRKQHGKSPSKQAGSTVAASAVASAVTSVAAGSTATERPTIAAEAVQSAPFVFSASGAGTPAQRRQHSIKSSAKRKERPAPPAAAPQQPPPPPIALPQATASRPFVFSGSAVPGAVIRKHHAKTPGAGAKASTEWDPTAHIRHAQAAASADRSAGNEAFKKRDYHTACRLYTKVGLSLFIDWSYKLSSMYICQIYLYIISVPGWRGTSHAPVLDFRLISISLSCTSTTMVFLRQSMALCHTPPSKPPSWRCCFPIEQLRYCPWEIL